jgi:uncharacterized protein with HEPN domain
VRRDDERLQDILEAIARIERHAVNDRDQFDRDEMLQTWYLHHLLIIGEAVRALSPELRSRHPEVPWPQIIAMRNIIIHEYFGIDRTEVWNAVKRDVPTLKGHVQRLLDSGQGE